MSKKSFLLGSVELRLDTIKELSQYFQDVLTYDANKKLVPKLDADGKPLKKLELNFSIFEEGNYGQNVSFTIPQSKEERENGERKQYVANGKIFYASDDLQSFVQRTKKAEEAKEVETIDDDMPF